MKNYERYSLFVNGWRRARFPARPSPEELRLFAELMEGKELLVLGSTPEFRDLGRAQKMHVTCADINPDMLHGMRLLMEHPNDDESLVECNWLCMPFKEGCFDLIMAEQSINIVSTADFGAFLGEVSRVLQQDGRFILKTITYTDESEEDVLDRWRNTGRDITYLYDHLFNRTASYKQHTASHAAIAEVIHRLLAEKKITQEEHKAFFEIYGPICDAGLLLHAYPQTAFEELLSTYFRIEACRYGEDEEKHRHHPIYILKKR